MSTPVDAKEATRMRRMSFGPLFDDPLSVVTGSEGTRYDCPDLAALDRHLETLRQQLEHSRIERVAAFRADIDLLLDRRMWLSLMALPDPCSTAQRALS